MAIQKQKKNEIFFVDFFLSREILRTAMIMAMTKKECKKANTLD